MSRLGEWLKRRRVRPLRLRLARPRLARLRSRLVRLRPRFRPLQLPLRPPRLRFRPPASPVRRGCARPRRPGAQPDGPLQKHDGKGRQGGAVWRAEGLGRNGRQVARWSDEAVEEYTGAQDSGDWNALSKTDKAKWMLRNPVAWMRSQNAGQQGQARSRMREYDEDQQAASRMMAGAAPGKRAA